MASRARGVAHVKQLKAKALREYELVLTLLVIRNMIYELHLLVIYLEAV